MNKEIARYIGKEETMAGAWARLDVFRDNPLMFTRELMQKIQASPEL
jgi:hypothetical protein